MVGGTDVTVTSARLQGRTHNTSKARPESCDNLQMRMVVAISIVDVSAIRLCIKGGHKQPA